MLTSHYPALDEQPVIARHAPQEALATHSCLLVRRSPAPVHPARPLVSRPAAPRSRLGVSAQLPSPACGVRLSVLVPSPLTGKVRFQAFGVGGMGISAMPTPLVLFLGLILATTAVHAKPAAVVRKLASHHGLPMDGTMPVATHVHKNRKWVPITKTEDAAAAASKSKPHPKLSALRTTARIPTILGIPSSGCIAQNQCCSMTAGLSKVPTSALHTLPYSSVVLLALALNQNDGTQIIATCSGTLALKSNIILTAGHCTTEMSGDNLVTELTAAVAYFGAHGGGSYSKAVKVVASATFADWANENIEIADHALLQLETAQSGHVYQTQDITHRFSHRTGYREPFTSVGFPGGGMFGQVGQMYKTVNPHRNQCMGLYASGTDVAGTYGLPLAIHEGMSGGPVFNAAGIIATNSFNFDGCPSGLCYNGYTPIDNTHYPLSHLISLLSS